MSDSDTVFAKIVRGEIPCERVYEDDDVLAFRDIHPAAPVHVLIIPKRALANLEAAGPDDEALLGHLLCAAAEVARREGVAADGYRLVLNNGRAAGQEVLHLHLHLLGGREFGWPPG